MGREIRKVPPNWDHPTVMRAYGREDFKPMFDRTYADAVREWKAGFAKWEAGERPDYMEPDDEYWDYAGSPPDREYYRPWSDDEATWFQVWETVSEGTPVSPPFATKDELIDYLAAHGDFWDQKRGDGPWPYANARSFVEGGYAPSMIVANSTVFMPRDGFPSPTPNSEES